MAAENIQMKQQQQSSHTQKFLSIKIHFWVSWIYFAYKLSIMLLINSLTPSLT